MEKASRLRKGWELRKKCKRLLLEYNNEWREEEDRKERMRKDHETNEQKEKAKTNKTQVESDQLGYFFDFGPN